ncbi:MAG: SAM-dependent chlorinase/fluorinase [Ignisphaera sp.]
MRRPCGVIVLMTDFGYEDPYVAAMKGVALDICPHVRVVDITHSIPSFDIDHAALTLFMAYKYYPAGTIFVVVVDPGVGSPRRPLLIVTRNYYFIGPDNGVLVLAARDDGIEAVFALENDLYFRKPVSSSFHGRDIFTPVASWLACGTPPNSFGSPQPVDSLKEPGIAMKMKKIDERCLELEAIYIDKFGNVMLSAFFDDLSKALGLSLGDTVSIFIGNRRFEARVEKVFSVVKEGEIVLYKNSFHLAELAVNKGSAKNVLGIGKRDAIRICKTVA